MVSNGEGMEGITYRWRVSVSHSSYSNIPPSDLTGSPVGLSLIPLLCVYCKHREATSRDFAYTVRVQCDTAATAMSAAMSGLRFVVSLQLIVTYIDTYSLHVRTNVRT